jgi:branched-chain amino acid transport system substrate-binding protein
LKKRGATSALIGSLIVGLLIGAGVIYAAAPSLGLAGGTVTSTVTSTVSGGGGPPVTVTSTVSGGGGGGLCSQTIHIGLLNDLSGELSAQGKGDLAAEQIAAQEINAWLKSAGCGLNVVLDSNDYKLDGPTALSQLQAMKASGVQVVIGPLNSGAARAILPYANSNHIVLISPSSTSPALNVTDTTNNYLFRTAPNDAAQGQAIAREMLTYGSKAVVIVNRDDTYGGGLANATKAFLLQDGLAASNIAGPIKYDPTATDFSALITQITSAYNSLNTGANAGKTYIVCVAFQEIDTILAQAKTSGSAIYNVVPWFGSDGTAQNSDVANSTSGAGAYAAHVVLPSTLFNVVNNSKTLQFYQTYKGTPQLAAVVGGGVFYTMEGYDDVWVAVLATLAAGKYDGTAIHTTFVNTANSFYGLTGWEGLSGNDRIPGSYQIWKVVTSGAGGSWVLAGTWDFNTDTVAWTNKP